MAKQWKVRDLEPTLPFREAARRIVATKYAELASYTDAALVGEDDEAIHDMRIAAKRLREALNIVRDGLPGKRARRARRDVNELNDALGGVRDCDVLLQWLDTVLTDASSSEAAAAMAIAQIVDGERDLKMNELRTALHELVPGGLKSDVTDLVGRRRIEEAMEGHG